MFYLKKYLNEISILNIPHLFIFNFQKNISKLTKIMYFIITFKNNYIFFYIIFFLFLFIFKNYTNIWNFEFFQIKKEFFSSIFYLKTFRKLKKKNLFF